MSVILTCPHSDEPQPFIGVDQSCSLPAIFCVQHSPHLTKDGLLHQMMPLGQFRRNLNEQKFKMADKVAVLTEQYSAFMDQLIREITELKLRKIVELSMLWLRELASTEDQYENLRRVYRNDFEGLTCKDAHSLYFKVVGNQVLEKKKIEQIECYREICAVMTTLQGSVKARMAITQKIAQLEGVVQKGELLKRALPDRRVLKENTKEILLQARNASVFEMKYNRVAVKENSRNFQSVFSKYQLIEHTNYHLLVTTKYTNIMLGICKESLKQNGSETTDLHYSPQSLVFNCSNGCLYRDGMFESGSSHLTKGQKVLELILRVTDMEMLILLGKKVVCRTNVQNFKKDGKVFLHLLMRTQGDSIQIDRDKLTAITEVNEQQTQPSKHIVEDIIEEQPSVVQQVQSFTSSLKNSIDKALIVNLNKAPPPSVKQIAERQAKLLQNPIQNMRLRTTSPPMDSAPMLQSLFQQRQGQGNPNKQTNMVKSTGLKQSIPLMNSLEVGSKGSKPLKPEERSKIDIDVEHSMMEMEPELSSSRYASHVQGQFSPRNHPQRQYLMNPAVMLPLKKSQFEFSLKSSAIDNRMESQNASQLPSMQMLKKRASDLTNTLNNIRGTQIEDDWIG